MSNLKNYHHPDLIVGSQTGDDAAVWQIDSDRAIVSTVDFIAPVLDDARTWGRIAAANSVSDVYAMGGRPLFALNIVCWNSAELAPSLLGELLAGGNDVASAAGFLIVGGHTVDDPEPKYGMAVTGQVDPERMLTNSGLLPNQDLVLTKPLGVGIITAAIKANAASEDIINDAVTSMIRLNDIAASTALNAGSTGATDVTGFGLLGHLGRMATESGVDVTLNIEAIPFLSGAKELASEGHIPGGTRKNLAWISPQLLPGSHSEITQLLLADAQTSGGLIFGLNPSKTSTALKHLAQSDHSAAVIGTTTSGSGTIKLE